MIKKSFIGVAVLLTALTFSLQSCKKGENDPALSFKSRVDRLKGDWVLTAKQVVLTEAANSGQIAISTKVTNGNYSGGQETILINEDSDLSTLLRKYDFDITFNEDGTYQYTLNVYRPTGTMNDPYDNYVYVTTGVWAWLDQGKDKLGLSLNSDFQPTLPDTLDAGTMLPYYVDGAYNIDRLASDELVLKRNGQFTTTVDTVVTNLTFDGTFTFGR